MHQRTKWFVLPKILPVFIVLILVVLLVSTTNISADWRSEYDQQKQEINSQMDQVNTELRDIRQKMDAITELKGSLKEQVAASEAEINKIKNLMDTIELSIAQIKSQLDYKQQELDGLEKQMRSILQEIQKQQRVSPIELILTSKSLGEAVGKVYNLSSLQVKADALKSQVKAAQKELEEDKNNLEKSKKDLQDSQYLIEIKKANLEELLAQTEGQESGYQSWLNALKDQQQQLSAQEAEINKQIQEEEARQKAAADKGSNGGNIPGPYTPANCWFEEGGNINTNLIQPTDKGVVTGNFGCPASYYLDGWPHDGIDIAHVSGTPIKATASGTIIKKAYESGGFGHFVIVKHDINGQRFYSIYAHLNGASPRSIGEYVNQGDVIAYMGSSGFATGVHLHFGLLSDSYEYTGNHGCAWGGATHSNCYDPARFIPSLRI